MSTAVLVGLIVFAVATLAGLAVAAQQGLRAWRSLKRLRRTMNSGMRELTKQLATLEAQSGRMPERLARLQAAQRSLDASVGEARVLLRAASEIAALVHGVRGFIPSR